ncbi:MAG: trypsin-like peptidase domain-containing protein, partial [Chloroflexota bacterium]|nr:trypsin-like peptidase domain-containing protein [Chloroflexota bacterium]
MQKPNYWLISFVVVLAVIVGVLGGAVMGGVAGYYSSQMAANVNVVAPIAPASNVSQTSQSVTPATSPGTTNLTLKEDSAVIDAVRKVKPAVVTVINQMQPQRGVFGRTVAPTASGSGVIIDPKGYIVTNNHVIEGEQSLQVIYADGSKANATVVGADTVLDIAVLKVSGSVPAVAQFGDSNALEPGQVAIAIGSPLGDYRGTVTVGVVSGLNRTVGQEQGLIQTDAAINNGNSGGPLVNGLGQVIGINTLVVRSTNDGNVAEGLGFAIPSSLVHDIVSQLIAQGRVEHPYIGISYQPLDPQIAASLNLNNAIQGVVVMQVETGSPADRAGLQVNDVITTLGSQTIDQDHPL